jgi:hypothetical protein
MLKALLANIRPESIELNTRASQQQPFVSPLAWAYFSAIQVILVLIQARAKIVELDMNDSGDDLHIAALQAMLKTALPHRADEIKKARPPQYFGFVDDLEKRLFGEIMRILDGSEDDGASARQAQGNRVKSR